MSWLQRLRESRREQVNWYIVVTDRDSATIILARGGGGIRRGKLESPHVDSYEVHEARAGLGVALNGGPRCYWRLDWRKWKLRSTQQSKFGLVFAWKILEARQAPA